MTAKAKDLLSRAAALALLAAVLAGCASTGTLPLAKGRLQQEAKDPSVGVVVLRFRTEGLPPAGTYLHRVLTQTRLYLDWRFAVANEATGWTFRVLDEDGQVFHARNDSLESDAENTQTGWVTFLAPPGTSYVAVSPGRIPLLPRTTAPSADRASAPGAPATGKSGFIGGPRIAVQVQPREIVYAGTLVATLECNREKPYSCPYALTLADESEIARSFVRRYLDQVAPASPMQRRLLTFPSSRTITVRDQPALR